MHKQLTAMLLASTLFAGTLFNPSISAYASEKPEIEETAAAPAEEEAIPGEEEAPAVFTVKLDANGGLFENERDDILEETADEVETVTKVVEQGSMITAVPVFKDDDNVTFKGWSSERGGDLIEGSDEGITPEEDGTYYAVWEQADTEESESGEAEETPEQEANSEDNGEDASTAETSVAADTISDDMQTEEAGSSDDEIAEEASEDNNDPAEELSGMTADPEETVTTTDETVVDKNEAAAAETAARSGNCGTGGAGNVKWSLSDDGTLTISGSGEMGTWNDQAFWGQEIFVPWHDYLDEIHKVVIGEGITFIGWWAFAHTHITSVTLPSTVKTLGQGAFAYCYELKEVHLNNGLETIEYSAFRDDSLDYLFIPASVKDISYTVFSEIDIKNLAFADSADGYKVVDGSVFQNGGKKLIYVPRDQTGTYTVPGTVQTIEKGAFESTQFTKVVLPNGVQNIEEMAFAYSAVEEINLPSTLKRIELNAFCQAKLKHLVIPSSVTHLGLNPFIDNNSLESVVINCSLDRSEGDLFYRCEGIRSVTLNADSTTIPEGTFAGCTKLESITLPKSVTKIGRMAYAFCENVKSVTLREGLTSIGEAAFYGTGITQVTVPASVTYIGPNAFPESAKVTILGNLIKKSDGTYVSNNEISQIEIRVKYGQSEARKMLSMINNFRKPANAWYYNESNKKVYDKELQPLQYDYDLEKAAMQRAAELAIKFSHDRPDGSDCFSAVTIRDSYMDGENIAYGFSSAKDAFTAWQETDCDYYQQGHRRNMLSAGFNCVGIGHVIYNGNHYWVQEFGRRDKVNTTATAAADGMQSVGMFVDNQYFDRNAVTISPGSYLLGVNESASLPSVTRSVQTKAGMINFLGNSLKTSWQSANNNIAKVVNGKVVGIAKGQTTLSCRVLGKTYSVVVIVGKLNTPKLKSAANASGGITIQWRKVAGAVNYRVFRKSGKQGWRSIGVTKKTKYLDNTAKNGVRYTYSVCAVTKDGKYKISDYNQKGIIRTFLTRQKLKTLKSAAAGKFTVKWKKNKSSNGYQIQYSTDKKFKKNIKTVTVKGASKTGKTISGLKKGKKYYVRMRSYKTVNKKKNYSAWSKSKAITVKKNQ